MYIVDQPPVTPTAHRSCPMLTVLPVSVLPVQDVRSVLGPYLCPNALVAVHGLDSQADTDMWTAWIGKQHAVRPTPTTQDTHSTKHTAKERGESALVQRGESVEFL
jgi:hypothetical protein